MSFTCINENKFSKSSISKDIESMVKEYKNKYSTIKEPFFLQTEQVFLKAILYYLVEYAENKDISELEKEDNKSLDKFFNTLNKESNAFKYYKEFKAINNEEIEKMAQLSIFKYIKTQIEKSN